MQHTITAILRQNTKLSVKEGDVSNSSVKWNSLLSGYLSPTVGTLLPQSERCDPSTLSPINPLNRGLGFAVCSDRVFQVSAEVNHHTTVSPLQEAALAPASCRTKAAILDYHVFTKLVCPLPSSHWLTFPSLRPPSPGKRGPLCCHGDERGRLNGGGGGLWKLAVVVETWPYAALCQSAFHTGLKWP